MCERSVQPSLALRNLFALSTEVGNELYAPVPTERELEENWIRIYDESCAEVRSRVSNLRRHTGTIVAAPVNIELVDPATALTYYRGHNEFLKVT